MHTCTCDMHFTCFQGAETPPLGQQPQRCKPYHSHILPWYLPYNTHFGYGMVWTQKTPTNNTQHTNTHVKWYGNPRLYTTGTAFTNVLFEHRKAPQSTADSVLPGPANKRQAVPQCAGSAVRLNVMQASRCTDSSQGVKEPTIHRVCMTVTEPLLFPIFTFMGACTSFSSRSRDSSTTARKT